MQFKMYAIVLVSLYCEETTTTKTKTIFLDFFKLLTVFCRFQTYDDKKYTKIVPIALASPTAEERPTLLYKAPTNMTSAKTFALINF